MFTMGVWLAGSLLFALVATENFYTIDRLLEASPNPAFRELIADAGRSESRELLRYLSSELNRLYFQIWSVVQVVLGVLTLGLVSKLPRGARAKWGVVAMLGILLLLGAWITPSILSIGRSLDFVPRDPPPPSLRTFGILHAAYTVLEFFKFVVGVIVAAWISRTGET